MSAFDFPDNAPVVDERRMVTSGWLQAMSRWHRAVLSVYDSGPTANRPTEGLWVGRQYQDTTLNKPVFVAAVKPTVWRDAAGVVV